MTQKRFSLFAALLLLLAQVSLGAIVVPGADFVILRLTTSQENARSALECGSEAAAFTCKPEVLAPDVAFCLAIQGGSFAAALQGAFGTGTFLAASKPLPLGAASRIKIRARFLAALGMTDHAESLQNNKPPVCFDLQNYISELERWSAFAGRLRDHPEEAAALRKQLPDSWLVVVREQRFSVSTQPFKTALDRIVRDPHTAAGAAQEISARLEWLLDDARAMSRTSVRDYGAARTKLDEILTRREFRFVRTAAESQSFWDRLLSEVEQWVIGLLSRAGNHPNVANFLRWGVVIALGLIFLAWLIYTLTHVSYRRLPAPRPPTPAAPSRDWMQEARSAAARGEFRQAIRMIYGAAVLLLGEAGAWRVDPSRTHREYARLLPADSTRRPHLIALTDCFEQVWYGRAQASAHDYEAALAELESLE